MADKDNQQVPAQIFLQTAPAGSHDEEGGGGSLDLSVLFDYLDMVRSRLWLFIAILVVIVAVAVIRLNQATPVYESSCQLQMQPRPLQISGMQAVFDPVGGGGGRDYYNQANQINTEIELMKTPDVLNQAFEELRLSDDPLFAGGDPIGILADGLRISRQEDTMLIEVFYRSPSAQKAAHIANFLSELYVRRYQERKREVSGGGIFRLQEQLSTLAVAREDALRALSEFKHENGLMDMDYERELIAQRIGALTASLIEAEMAEREAVDMIETVSGWHKEGHIGAIVQVVDSPFARSFRGEFLRMQMELPELLGKFGAGHAQVRTREQIIANLEAAILQEIDTSLVALELKRQRSTQRREVILAAIKELEADLFKLDSFSAKYYRLQDTYEATEAAYRKVIARINDVNISVNTDEWEGSDFLRVVRRAVPSVAPVWPQKRRSLGMALFFGLALGGGACIFLGMLDTSVKNRSDIDRCLKDSLILGYVPARSEKKSELDELEDVGSHQAEAFRSIRTSLSLSLKSRGERCFAITSSMPGDGKTTVALNLAIALARDNHKTLLLECDMRRPRLKEIISGREEIDVSHGLSTLLAGDDELETVVHGMPNQAGLEVVLCGPHPPNPSELLGTERFAELLKKAQAAYDYIIIDSPPLLGVADAAILAGQGIPLICVVRLFRTTRHDLRLTGERMQTTQAKHAGVVVNQAEVPKHGRYGYYGYHRYGGYGKYGYAAKYGYGSKGGEATG